MLSKFLPLLRWVYKALGFGHEVQLLGSSSTRLGGWFPGEKPALILAGCKLKSIPYRNDMV
jgi:hypothetical protein